MEDRFQRLSPCDNAAADTTPMAAAQSTLHPAIPPQQTTEPAYFQNPMQAPPAPHHAAGNPMLRNQEEMYKYQQHAAPQASTMNGHAAPSVYEETHELSEEEKMTPVVPKPRFAEKQLPPGFPDVEDEDDMDEEEDEEMEEMEDVDEVTENAEGGVGGEIKSQGRLEEDDTENQSGIEEEEEVTENQDVEEGPENQVGSEEEDQSENRGMAEEADDEDIAEEDDESGGASPHANTAHGEDLAAREDDIDETSRTEEPIADQNSSVAEEADPSKMEDMEDEPLESTEDLLVNSGLVSRKESEADEASSQPSESNAESTTHVPRRSRGKVLRKKRPPNVRRLFSDSITVQIPLSLTVDLGVAMKRSREKRVAAFYARFPELEATEKKGDEGDEQEAVDEDGEGPVEKTEKRDKRPKLSHAPQRKEYSSMLDYLEAKYVQGVMIDDQVDDDDEGQGSVYSETSFLDDSGLQRTVAEQVMGQATTTKLERQEDDAFFVNVGELEVEESEFTKQGYDPLQDLKNDTKKSRKRKKPPAEPKPSASGGATKSPPKPSQKKKAQNKTAEPSKKKAKATSAEDKKAAKPQPKAPAKAERNNSEDTTKPNLDDPLTDSYFKASVGLKSIADELHDELVDMIKTFTTEQLPAKEKAAKVRVVINVPQNKKAGDMIKFANPHNKSQKIQAKIPAGKSSGDSFKVTITKPTQENPDATTADTNNIPRDFYGLLDEFARAYDEWCDAEGIYRKAIKDKEFSAHLNKRQKFDTLLHAFPTDLKTPVDKAYLQRILRRARQSKQKRAQTLAKQKVDGPSSTSSRKSSEADNEENGETKEETKDEENNKSNEDSGESEEDNEKDEESSKLLNHGIWAGLPDALANTTWRDFVPKASIVFSTKTFDSRAFDVIQ